MTTAADVLVIGGGLAGSTAALELARHGRRVVLLEKSRDAHHKVCGEFLSRESLHYLQRQNVDLQALGAVSIDSVRLVTRSHTTEAKLPFAAMSVTRRALDEELLRLAAEAGAEVHRGANVDFLGDDSGSGWTARLRGGEVFRAADAFLATGKHDLRGWPRPQGTHRGLVGFKMYFCLTPAQRSGLGPAVELILFPGGYAGLQPVEGGAANLCLLIDAQRLQQIGGSWAALLQHLRTTSPHLAARLEGARPLLEAPLAASHIPYGHVQQQTQPGLWRIGDQAAVIPSFCGDGMAIALHSGALAATHLLRGGSSSEFQQRLHRQLSRRLGMATRLSQMLAKWPRFAGLVRSFPALLPGIALMTRIPDRMLLTDARAHK